MKPKFQILRTATVVALITTLTQFLSFAQSCDPGMNTCVTQGNSNLITANIGIACGYLTPNVSTGHDWQVAASCSGWTRVGGLRPVQIPPAFTPFILTSPTTCPNSYVTVNLVALYTRINPAPPPFLEFCTITNVDSFFVRDLSNPVLTLPADVILDVDDACTVTLSNLISWIGAANVADNCTDDATLLANLVVTAGFPVPDLVCPTSPNAGTVVTFQTSDACGNLSNLESVTVRLRDISEPVITCPGDEDRNFNGSCQYTVEDFRGLASSTDQCGNSFTYSQRVLAVSNPAEGPFANNAFPTITGGCQGPRIITVRICSQDCFGNGDLDPAPAGPLPSNCCTFNVTVTDNTPPAPNTCPAQTIVNVDAGCTALLPDLRNALLFTDNCSIIDPAEIGMYADLDGDGSYETELFAPGTPVIPGATFPTSASGIICNPLFPNGDVDVQFTFVDCNGNPTGGPVTLNCPDLLRIRDVTPPDFIALCPDPAPVFYLDIDPNTCIYSNVIVPQDFFNGLAFVNDNCDPDAIEHNDPATFGCSQLGFQNIGISGEDCSGNVSGLLGFCQVLVQVNPLDAAWSNPGIVCMSQMPLDLCTLLEGTARDCGYWSGDYVVPGPPDNRCNGGTPATFDPPGPGVYTVTYTVGDANCHVELTRTIQVEQNVSTPLLVNDFGLCICPDELIDLESFLLQSAPQGGEWQILSQSPDLGGPVTPGVNIIPPTGQGFSHLAKYDGGCLILNLRYTLTDCSGATFSDDIAVTIHECPKGSFDLPDDLCQDFGYLTINDTNRVFSGCDDYEVTFDVTAGPSGNLLIGGAPVTGTLATLGAVPVYADAVQAGTYTIRMTIVDPTGAQFGCPDFVYTQEVRIYQDGDNPNGIAPVGPLCEGTTTWPVTLNIQNLNDEAGFPLTADNIRWTGSGVSDLGTTASFQPADTDGDGWPGPGLFTVCVDLGDPRCNERYCTDILINNDIPDAANDLIDDYKLCVTPGTLVSYSSLLANGSMSGGVFTANLSAISVPPITGLLLPNGFFYTGGCGDLNVTYTLPADCNQDNINNDVIITFCPRPDVEINGPSVLCTRDNPVTITSNMVGRLPQCDQTGVWTVSPATAGLIGGTDGTASFSPVLAGEGNFVITYTLTTGAGCSDASSLTIQVNASSDPFFATPGPLCIDGTPVTISLTNPNPSVQDGNALNSDGRQEIIWTSSCGACLTPQTDSVNAVFNPTAAGPGDHLVCVTTGDPGCMQTHCTLVRVSEANNATLVGDLEKGCRNLEYSGFCGDFVTEINLADFYTSSTTRGGFWTDVTGDGCRILNETFEAHPGCHRLRYTVPAAYPGATGACGVQQTEVNLLITEEPQTDFDLAEEVCWDGIAGSVTLPTVYTGATFGTNAQEIDYTWYAVLDAGAGPIPTFTDDDAAEPGVIIQGAGTFRICLTETIVYDDDCGTISPSNCINEHCEILVVHQTTAVANPSWTAVGPYCVDNACIDLDALITGTTGGVFTGVGVQLDPAHPNYRFCPAVAGPGTHAVTYTVQNGAGCTAVQTHNIVVYPEVLIDCPNTNTDLQCATMALGPNNNTYGPYAGTVLSSRYTLGFYSLNSLLCAGAPQGGFWTYLTGPTASAGAIQGSSLYFTDPGCYTVRYTVSSYPGGAGACTDSEDFTVFVGERPNPSFDLPDAVCWDQVTSITYDINTFRTSPVYTGSVVRNYRSTNTAVANVSAGGVVSIVGNGTASICMEEVITTIDCDGGTETCTAEVCEVIRVVNSNTVVNPAWSALGPLCIDQACQDLDALVTGTPNGVFTGHGVVLAAGGHPNYEFCPSIAGVGTHVVTYTVVSADGCSASFSRNVVVAPARSAVLLTPFRSGCIAVNGFNMIEFDLTQTYLAGTTRGGTWTKIAGPASAGPFNETYYGEPGCHQLRYTIPPAFPGATGACGQMSFDLLLTLSEHPVPSFDMTEELCWDGIAGSVVLNPFYNGETYGSGASSRTYNWTASLVSGAGPVPTFNNNAIQNPTLTVQGAGIFEICLTETLISCDDPGYSVNGCSENYCKRITIHQTNVEANPSWTAVGPYCVDQPCIDLDALVTGTPNGVFTGAGVVVAAGGHPNYEFCPGLAGPGVHAVTYTVNNGAGCTAVETHNIVVHPAVTLACADTRDTIQCATRALGSLNNNYGPFNGTTLTSRYTMSTHALNQLLCAAATKGGSWSYVSGPTATAGTVANGVLHYTDPGCYTVRYTVSSYPGGSGACSATQDFTIHVGEMPNPSFDLPDAVCWDQVSTVTYDLSSYLTSPAYTYPVARTYRSTNNTIVTVNAGGLVTIVGNGTASICINERITTTACSGVTSTCDVEYCQVIRVENNTTVVNPAWSPLGPLCIDQACQDLDALVTGTPNGIFTGNGVVLAAGGHPNYEFCPALAGVGTHVVTYTVNSPDGCTASFSRNVVVAPARSAVVLSPFRSGCIAVNGFNMIEFDLTQTYLPGTTRGGTWSKIAGPPSAGPFNETYYGEPGCHQLRYTVPPAFPGATGACGQMSFDLLLTLSEQPVPSFDLAEEVCWDGIAGSVVLNPFYNGETYGSGASSRTYNWTASLISGAGPLPTFNNNTLQNPTLTVQGAGTFEICLIETLISCNDPGYAVNNCSENYCKRIVIHANTIVADPSWTAVGPYCVDQPCVDLDALVTGTTGGVFSGTGVIVAAGGHPNYEFCPGLAGPGTHAVTYTVQNGAGCTAVETHNIVVYPAVTLACVDTRDTIQCATMPLGPNNNTYGPFNGVTLTSRYTLGSHNLTDLLCATATRGGTWSYLSGPAASTGAVVNNTLHFTTPGCYTVRYTVSSFPGGTGACLATQDFTVHVGERPNPSFDLPDAVCWNQLAGSITYDINNFRTSPIYAGTVSRNYRSTNTSVVTVNLSGLITVVGNGTASVCMEELINTNACGVATTCRVEVCEVIRVINSVTINNPEWGPLGPLCIDMACQDLDALIAGTTGGVFTGRGVRVAASGHPNYEFCPALAGIGIHVVTYTVNSPDGCSATFSRNVEVRRGYIPNIGGDRQRGCFDFSASDPFTDFDLSEFYLDSTYRAGTWSLAPGSALGTIRNETLSGLPGCFQLVYTVPPSIPGGTGACGEMRDTAWLRLIEEPQPDFDVQDAVCWEPGATVTITPFLNSGTFGTNATINRSWALNPSSPAGVSINSTTGVVTIGPSAPVTPSTFAVCLTETLTYPACGPLPSATVCSVTKCHQIKIESGTPLISCFTASADSVCVNTPIILTPLQAPFDGIWTSGDTTGGKATLVRNANGTATFTPRTCGSFIVTYTRSTPNGCTNTCSRTIRTDLTPPQIILPGTRVVECDGTSQTTAMANWANTAGFTDNCPGGSIRWQVYDRRSGCSQFTGTYVFEFEAIDFCGNRRVAYDTFRIVDRIAPVITPGANLTINCGIPTTYGQLDGWLNTNGGATATDVCSRVRWTNNFNRNSLVLECNNPLGTPVVFRATDECGNFSEVTHRVFLIDNNNPVWNVRPVNLTIECDGTNDPYSQINAWVSRVGDGVAVDSCSTQIFYSHNYTGLTPGCSRLTGSALVTFTARDFCGNSVTAQATVTVVDRTAPVVVSPAKDTVVDCDGAGNITAFNTWIRNRAGARAQDVCTPRPTGSTGDIGILRWDTLRMRTEDDCGLTRRYTFMFTATDSCGNTSPATIARFIIQDTTAPTFVVLPQNLTVSCDRLGNEAALNSWLNNNGGAVATDVCNNGPLNWRRELIRELDQCSNTARYTYRFTVMDSCRNSTFRDADFVVVDVTPPVITGGYNKLVECDQSGANNDAQILSWLDSLGGLSATDNCSDAINWRHNFSDNRWVRGCGDTRFQDVTFTATDDCGNFATRTLRVGTQDTTVPVFFNCPRPPIVVAAETFHCDAYVNFSPVAAFDNCSTPVINQIDSTGLKSGSRFPVGTTVLVFEAVDGCGNRDTCTMKIIVNDYWDLPTITCPAPATFSASLDSCGRTLTAADGINPSNITDNCPNTVVTFVVTDQNGQVVNSGFNSAAGTFFPVGVDTITYCVFDQPLLKITEVTQQLGTPIAGGTITIGRTNPVPAFISSDLIDGDYLEIGNYGGGVIDLTCLSIEIVGPAGSICDYTIPPMFPLKPRNFLAPGQVAVFHVGSGTDVPASRFWHMNCTQAGINDQRAYILRLNDRVIDVVATNGFNPVGRGTLAVVKAEDWAGATDPHFCRGSYYRTNHIDNNRSSDFELAESCNAATIGSWNPGNKFSSANLDTASVQSIVHPAVCCKVPITITDNQAPICGRYDTLSSGIPTNLNVAFAQGVCFSSTVTIPNNCKVGDIRILNMTGSSSQNLGDWEVTLVSPSGTRVKLWENVCNAATSFNLNFGSSDNKGLNYGSVNGAPCTPNFGNGGFYQPQESFLKFFNEQGQGTWRLEIEDNSCNTTAITNVLTNWRLQVLCKAPAVLRDTTITADFRQCNKKFLWYHPLINDNCTGGTVEMTYVTTCTTARTGVVTTVLGPITRVVTAGACDSLVLPIGTTKISYQITDRSGNTGMCMFNVNVRDINGPIIPVYKDVTVSADAGECGKFFYFVPDANDSCGLDTVWANPPSGTFFKVGTNRICIYAIDKSGNRDSSCFNLVVNPYIPNSSELACNDKINLSLDASCRAELTADMILEGGKHWCYDQYEIIVTDDRGVRRSNIFTYADVGKCFRVTIRDPRSGNSCWGEVCIEDKQKPVLECPRDTVVNCISTLDPSILGTARVITCEPSATINYWDEYTELGECAFPYVARIVRYWTVEDENGNRDTCEQRIDVERFDLADIRWPRNYDDLDLPHLECDKKINDKDISAHFQAYPYCVDGYLLDSAIWSATGGFYPSPAGDLAGRRLPKSLGWNCLEVGPYQGHPNPYPVYYDAHPGWTPQSPFCWGPDEIVKWIGTGVPTVDGIDLYTRGRCAVSIRYEDEVYEICDDSYEILRYWKIRNMCLPVVAGQNPIEYIQVIKVLDKKGPEIVYPDTIAISTTNNSCTAIWDLAEPWMKDNCSDDLSYSVRMWAGRSIRYANGRWAVINIPIGLHKAEITAQDACGNKTVKTIMVNVFDGITPTPVCRTFTTVNITGNQSPGENYARVAAEAFDEGSHDNCANHLFFKVIRMAELLGTNNGSNSNNTVACGGRNGDDNSTLAGNQVYFDDYTDFCCADAGQRVMVVLRVFDVDPGPGPVAPARMTNRTSPLFGRFNDCMVEVEVQNKNVPTVVAPPNIVVSCWFWFDIANLTDPNDATFGRVVTDLSDRKKVVTQDIVCRKYCERNDITGYPGFVQTNTVPKPAPNQACDYYFQYFDTAHWDRKYELTWGFDGYALNSCNVSPTITVNDLRECGQGIIQRIISAQGPNNINVTAIQTIYVVDCDPFYVDSTTCNDPRFSDVMWPNGVCTQTPVTINGCGSDISPDNPQLGRPQIVNNADDNCALISIEHVDEVFTIEPDACMKIIRKWIVIDWCQYDPFIDPNKGRWERIQIIKVRDQDKPVVSCNVGPCEPASINSSLGICVGHISLTAIADDNCSPLDWLLWEYKIDAFNDGVGVHGGYDFRVGSLTRRAFAAGDTVEYSHNPFADNAKNPFDASGTYPLGIHKISWFVEDGCGNVGVCETLFEIKDCKAPTPYCYTGVITVPMPSSGCVDVWAKDLDLGSFDNCTAKDKLLFYFDGDKTKQSITVCCDDFVAAGVNDELRLDVEMWVEDEEGNRDYCKTVVIVQDNQGICPDNANGKARITGLISDEKGEALNPVEVSLYRNGNMLLQRSGNPFLFGDLTMNVEYELVPDRNDDPLNGVSTQDIVKIQKHILGLEAIGSPYKLLAADVNNSNSITAADIAEIRKLVLGITSEFAKSRSWSFVPGDHVFSDPTAPWQAPRRKTVMLDNSKSVNFMGFKMGDVTGNAIAGLNGTSQVRTSGALHFEMDEMNLVAGENYRIAIRSSDFEMISGYQYTLRFDQQALAYTGFEAGALGLNESNFGLMKLDQGVITTSWNSNKAESFGKDEVLFTLNFTALKAGKLSQMFAITSDITRAEAYHVSEAVRDVRIGVRTQDGVVESSLFELYQNEPNPFTKQTVVAFRLPEAGQVKLTIYDAAGKVVRVYEFDGIKGLNQITIHRSEVNASGVLYYQLDAQNHTATKRMIVAE